MVIMYITLCIFHDYMAIYGPNLDLIENKIVEIKSLSERPSASCAPVTAKED